MTFAPLSRRYRKTMGQAEESEFTLASVYLWIWISLLFLLEALSCYFRSSGLRRCAVADTDPNDRKGMSLLDLATEAFYLLKFDFGLHARLLSGNDYPDFTWSQASLAQTNALFKHLFKFLGFRRKCLCVQPYSRYTMMRW
ncbi:hypothetical protein FA13DRAFT_555967 [Coprinellus micaceus]|uniref:Uncharacterized protein n=1 Tax=Coprinellus micaceus TaxID=71717 RepID=A0A4Y7SCU2_COPMI|nr:hypothetical protein FA13DRAFT_555967 [Coprinellus micaceus]